MLCLQCLWWAKECALNICTILTQINDFQHGEKPVLKIQVLCRCFGTVVFYEGETACPQYLVVSSLNSPVEVGQAKLVVVDRAVADTVWGPRRKFPLQQVAGEHLWGSRPGSSPTKRAGKQDDFKKSAVYLLQKLLHGWCNVCWVHRCSLYLSSGAARKRLSDKPVNTFIKSASI